MARTRSLTRRGRLAVFGVLYFSEGAPIGFLWWAMPTLLRAEDVAVERITALTAALVLPWTLKFLWAPLVDAARGPRWGLRHWIGAAQGAMGLCLVPLVFIDPAESFGWWFGLLLAHAVCAATQDVAIDALAVNTVPAAERGRVNAAMQVGMLTGRSLFGGGAILVAGAWGWGAVFGALVAAVGAALLVVVFQLREAADTAEGGADADRGAGGPGRRFRATVVAALRARPTWWGLGFALTAGAGFEAAGALAGPLLVDLGVATAEAGWFFALPVVVAMALGGVVGGWWADRGGRARRVARFVLLLNGLVALLVVALWSGAGGGTAMVLLAAVYVGIGLFTASSYALFMDLTDPRLGGTQFSAFMAATNACEAWAAWTAGRLVADAGYGPALLGLAAVALVGLGFLRPLRRREAAAQR